MCFTFNSRLYLIYIWSVVTRNFKSIRILVWSSKIIKSIFLNNSFNRKGVYNYEEGKGFFSRNLESIIAICKMHDILPVFMTQPNRNLLDNEQAIEYNEIIRNICIKHNVQLFDIAEARGITFPNRARRTTHAGAKFSPGDFKPITETTIS